MRLYHQTFDGLSLRERTAHNLVPLTPATKLQKFIESTGETTNSLALYEETSNSESYDEEEKEEEEDVLLSTSQFAPTPHISTPQPPSQFNVLSNAHTQTRFLSNCETDVPFTLRENQTEVFSFLFLSIPQFC